MPDSVRFLICSDIHYASEAEKARVGYEAAAVANPLARGLLKFYRRYYWLRDPFAHNHLLERVTNPPFEPDWVIANGDYSCDSAFIGVSDPPSLQSARESLGILRARFPGKVLAVFGDHELGKMSLLGNAGGLRLKSFELAQSELGLEPIWTRRFGKYLLVGITSTLAAMRIYERETLDAERDQWRELARQHLHSIEAVFNTLRDDDRVLLFCHDPTALPFLWELAAVRKHIHHLERTIIGHLHSPIILRKSRLLSGLPRIGFLGQSIRRMSSALSKARDWKHFRILLCPSLAGLQITKHGGFYEMRVEESREVPARFQFHRIEW